MNIVRINYHALIQGEACYPARDHLLSSDQRPFFNNRYAAINCRTDFHHIFWSLPSIRAEKRPEFLAKTFFCICRKFGCNMSWISGKDVLFFGLRHRFIQRKAWISGEDLSCFGLHHQFGWKKTWISGKDLSFLICWNGGDLLEPC